MANVLGGATWTNPLAITGSQVNATNTTTPVTSKTGSKAAPSITSAFNYNPASAATAGSGGGGISAPQVSYDDNSGQSSAVTPYAAAPVYVDPYSSTVFGSTANFNRIHGDWLGQKDATMGSITDRIQNDRNGYESTVKDFGTNVERGQTHLNESFDQNELARIEGGRGVQDMVGTGVRSAGVVIGNKPGASTSSARDAIARAYSQIGQREMNKVGNQFEKGQHDIGIQQDDFNSQVSTDARHLSENKVKIVNDIATEAASKIASLNAAAASASLDDRMDIEAEKARVKNEALATLSQLDSVIADYSAKAHPNDRPTRIAHATQMANAGQVAANPFNFTADVPQQFQNTGQFESGLPLFQAPRKDNQL